MKYYCPCCGNKTMEHKEAEYHDICPVCFWENDPVQNENDEYAGGSNEISLKKAKENFSLFGAISKSAISFIRSTKKNE